MFKGSGLMVFEALRFWVCGMGLELMKILR